MFYDDIDQCEVGSTRIFVGVRCWWPEVYRNVTDYLKACEGYQHDRRLPSYHTNLRASVTRLLETFSIGFAGPFSTPMTRQRFVLIDMEHMTGWTIAWATKDATLDTFIRFVEPEIIMPFGSPRRIVSDNATAFMVASVQELMGRYRIDWKSVLTYAPIAIGRAERMVGIIKQVINRYMIQNGGDRAEALPRALYGYRRRNNSNPSSPFRLIYGVNPKMLASDAISLISEVQRYHRLIEVLSDLGRFLEKMEK